MHCKETYQSLKLLQEVGEPIKLLKSTQDGLVLREESLDMSDQSETGDNNGVVVTCNTPTCLLVEGLSLSHEEFNGLFGEIVQYVMVVLWWNDLLHQPHLTLDESEEDSGRSQKGGAALQLFLQWITNE